VSDTGSTTASGKDEETNIHARDNESLIPHGPLTRPSHGPIYPLSYMMRTDVGKGPLELLALRGFVLPKRIFVDKVPVVSDSTRANP
jgi:type VI secretion system protein ImpL